MSDQIDEIEMPTPCAECGGIWDLNRLSTRMLCDECEQADDESALDWLEDVDPCNFCPHDNTDHRGDGCLHCGCAMSQ